MTSAVNYNSVSRWTKTLLLLAVAIVAIVFSVVCLMRLQQNRTISLSLLTDVPAAFQGRQPPPAAVPPVVQDAEQLAAEEQLTGEEPTDPFPASVMYQSPPLTINPGPCPAGQERRLPNAIIIGIRKAGTKAILSYLDLHSKIRVTEQDEMHFFDTNNNYYLGMDWYRSKMPCTTDEQLTIEKTPAYFFRNYVPERVHWMNPDIKLLLVVREPVERAISDYMQVLESIYHYDMNQTFEELAIKKNGDVDTHYTAIQWSMYYKYMHNWLHWFSLDHFYFINAADLFKKPSKALEGVEQFLGLQHEITKDMFYFNATRGFFCLHKPDGSDYCMPETKGRPHPPVDPKVVHKLKKFFKPYNELFYRTTGQDFGW